MDADTLSGLNLKAKLYTAAVVLFPGMVIAIPFLASDVPVWVKSSAIGVPVVVRAAWVYSSIQKGRWLRGRTWRR